MNAQKKAAEKQQQQMAKLMAQQAKANEKAMKSMEMPQIAAPKLAPIPAAPQMTSSDTVAAQADAMQQSAKRYGLTKTRVAGETGGYLGGNATPLGGSTLLSATR